MNNNLCDFFGCSNLAVAESPILDEDGEDQGTEWLCKKHHPNGKHLKSTPVEGLLQFDPTNFEQMKAFVLKNEAIQNDIRNHQSL